MSQHFSAASRRYLHAFLEQVEYLNEATIFIWLCGTLFTRLAAGVWVGDRPPAVLLTILTIVYLYMHRNRYHAMLIRFPIVLVFFFVLETHFQAEGLFSRTHFVISWKQLALAWMAMNFSLLFQGEESPSFLERAKSSIVCRTVGKDKKIQAGKIIPFHGLRSV